MKKKNKIIVFNFILFLFLVFSFNCAEKKDKVVVEIDYIAPSAPVNLTVYVTTNIINLYWNKNQETDFTKYRLYRSTSSILSTPDKTLPQSNTPNFKNNGYVEETGTSYTDTDISAGITYYYRVSALDKSNNESNKSNQIQVTYGDHIPPLKPIEFKAAQGTKSGEIFLSWTANSEADIMSYNIYISDLGGSSYKFFGSSTANSYTAKGLSPDIEYFFYITALDTSSNESESSNLAVSISFGDTIPLVKPSGLIATPGSKKGEVDLNWTASTEADFLSYNIYAAVQGGSDFVFLAGSSVNSYTAKDLTSGYGYYFQITAVDISNNESEYSDSAFSIAKGDKVAPEAPIGVSASVGVSKGKINISWTSSKESDLAKYKIYQSANGGSSYSEIDNITGAPPDTTYIASGLTTGTYYFYKISAIDDSDNESALSNRSGSEAP